MATMQMMRCVAAASVTPRMHFSCVVLRERKPKINTCVRDCTFGRCAATKRKRFITLSARPTTPVQALLTDDSSKLRGVIFDMDGVLCESEGICRRAASKMFLDLYHIEVPESDFIPLQGTGDRVYFERIAEKYDVESFQLEAAQKRFFELYLSLLEDTDITFPGATELVQACLSAGLKVGIASGAGWKKVNANLGAVGLDPSMFDAVLTGDSGIKIKPDPDIFLKTSVALGIPPKRCIVIEDSVAGVTAAKAAGMVCIGVVTTEIESTLINVGADVVFKSISSIGVADLISTFRATVLKQEEPGLQNQVQDWLGKPVELPGSWKTDRRSVLQIVNFGLASSCVYLLFSRSQALSFMNAKSFVAALNPFSRMPTASNDGSDRVEAFRRYIADVEKKGGGLEVRDFPAGQDWFNAPPLSLRRDLRGRLVLLDFWTYCCINCMHVLPDLAYIDRQFAREPVTVVGVHSAKFDNERDSDAIRNAVLRYDISHPVVNDRNMTLWRDLGVNSWPTLIVVSPKGQVLFTLPGEGHRQDLVDVLTAGLQYYGERDLLDNKTIPMAPEKLKDNRLLNSNLRFPGKLAVDVNGNRLFISDSNNHRIIITSLGGEFVDQIGGNGAKLLDGAYESCCFKRPQGICYDGNRDVLYVADTENHALRQVDLKEKVVRTLAGNGYQGRDYKGGAKGKLQQLSSPWDIEMGSTGTDIFVAMAGQHQIWKYDARTQIMKVFSGNGYERNKNGDNGQSTSWAQPSGLSLLPVTQSEMIVADSESSSIRKLNLSNGGSRGISGGDPLFAENLFRFGDKDGAFGQALLQHPLGVLAIDEDKVLIADSYNHKIKLCDLSASSVRTLSGSGAAGYADGQVNRSLLSEPSGLALGPSNTVFVADTNNNLIRTLDVSSGVLSTLELTGVPPPRVSPLEEEDDTDATTPTKVIVSDEAQSRDGVIDISVSFPRGYGFTKGATSSFTARFMGDEREAIRLDPKRGIVETNKTPNIKVQYSSLGPLKNGAKIQIDCKIYYCEVEKECLLEDVRFEVPFSAQLREGVSNVDLLISPVADS